MYPNFFKNKPTYPKPYNMRKLFIMQKSCKTVTNSNPYLENSLHNNIPSKLTGVEQSCKYISSAFLQICAKFYLLITTKKKKAPKTTALNRTLIFTVIFD